MKYPIKIGVAEDNLLLRQGLVSLLTQKKTLEVLFDVNNGQELLDTLKKKTPDIILFDLKMPIINGRETYAKIKKRYPQTKVMILSDHYNDVYITQFILDGVAGFLPKQCNFEKLTEAIFTIADEGRYFDAKISGLLLAGLLKNKIASEQNSKVLSKTQKEIIRLLYEEKNTKEIGSILFLSTRTIEWHRTQILEKTGSKTFAGMLKYALNNGIISL